jgi:hypothetical protein
MKKTKGREARNLQAEEMPEHDFSNGIRGKYYRRAQSRSVQTFRFRAKRFSGPP